jgi:cell division protein FtsI/penicillin-binding protein 2
MTAIQKLNRLKEQVWTMRNRALVAGLCLVVVFSLFSFRLVLLHGAPRHEQGQAGSKGEPSVVAKPAGHRRHVQTLPARRGAILDFNNRVLARDLEASTVVADFTLLDDLEAAAEVLARHLHMDVDGLVQRLDVNDPYIIIRRNVPRETALALMLEVRERGLKGVRLEPGFVRDYPHAPLLANVLGTTDYENLGVMGVEHSWQKVLGGKPGSREMWLDRAGRELVGFSREEQLPEDGRSLRLTIDLGAQSLVEEALDTLVAQYAPAKAVIVVMDPHTGNLMALGSRVRAMEDEKQADIYQNPVFMDQFEPGSIFKMIVASAALNEGVVGPNTLIDCEYGKFRYNGVTLNDFGSYDELTVTDVLVKSSNIGAAKMALMLGEERFYRYITDFGFGRKTGLGLRGETRGTSHAPGSRGWSNVSITQIPMGQGIAVTPLQMVTAASAIANGGLLLQPRLVDAVTDERGVLIEKMPVVQKRRVLRESTARQVREMLNEVVTPEGTGKRAQIPGLSVCGKTGTAQKATGRGGYSRDEFVTSFLGFLPREYPRFVMLVTLDAPQVEPDHYFGGVVAAPIFADLSSRLADYLGVARTVDVSALE